MNGLTRVFLVLLRLAIGWHFFFEGFEKIRSVDLVGPTETNRPWTSKGYLREATGPLGNYFRSQAGDLDKEALALFEVQPLQPDQDSSRVPARRRISPALDSAWNEYLSKFETTYRLSDEQRKVAQAKLDQAKEEAVRWLLGQCGEREVEKTFGPAATIKVKESPRERIEVYRRKVGELSDNLTKKFPALGRDVEKQKLAALKSDINRMRGELLGELERPMQEALQSVLIDEQKKSTPANDAPNTSRAGWSRIDWIDVTTRYGLTAVGACLLLGLFTRSACLGGAAFLLLFYLAAPALPWLPEGPRAEGHYLFVNKNIIEMLALLTLATTRSGRWAGLDGLIHLLIPGRRRNATDADGEANAVAARLNK
jgi:uncharacterized membrane protein YphA (DoxX/SURF4 family)